MHTFVAPKQNQPQRRLSSNFTRPSAAEPAAGKAHSFLHLQRTIGDQAVQRMLQANGEGLEAGSDASATTGFGHDFSRIPVYPKALARLQPKLTVNTPGDIYEQEADRVAEQVCSVERRSPESEERQAPIVQHMCAACSEEDENDLQAKEFPGGGPKLSIQAESRIVSMRGGGQPLPMSLRSYFEPRFGRDLSDVRLHTGPQAAETARTIRAHAFTVGRDVAFASGEYRPESHEGRRLLAHELVHTIQQGTTGERVQRTDYVDCTDDQLNTMVLPAKSDAIRDLDDAIMMLAARPLSPLAAGALWLAFRQDDEATADKVKSTLQEIRDGLESGTVECEQPDGWQFMCESGRLGYTLWSDHIHICMNAWPGASAKLRSLNMIHEGAHAFSWLIGDPGYFDYYTCEETAETEPLDVAHRLDTPDAYSCFVSYVKYDTGIPARADQYRGLGLSLQQDPAGPVNLNGTDEKNPLFKMAGAPDHSGFLYRWVIADDTDRRYLMRADTGNPFRFGPHPTAYIGAATRALLKERGITSGLVLCRVQVSERRDQLFARHVTFS